MLKPRISYILLELKSFENIYLLAGSLGDRVVSKTLLVASHEVVWC